MHREQLLAKWRDPVPVLDHGFVQLLDVMGDDQAVLQAARTTSQADSKGDAADRKLIRYLMRHRHVTPFESCNLKLRVKLPIFVERQWVRHRAAWLNEVSARYTQLPEETYIPDPSVRPMAQSRNNRQGSEGEVDSLVESAFTGQLSVHGGESFHKYRAALAAGVAKEIARCFLPLNTYTAKVWGTSLRMALHFLGLRADPHAQWEIRQYAEVICDILQDWVPWTFEAFTDYQLEAHTFSGPEVNLLRALLADPAVLQELPADWATYFGAYGVETKRERGAFLRALGLIEE